MGLGFGAGGRGYRIMVARARPVCRRPAATLRAPVARRPAAAYMVPGAGGALPVGEDQGGFRCIRCGHWFRRAQSLGRHLGAWRYAKYQNGTLTVGDCVNNRACDLKLKFGIMIRSSPGRLQKVLLRPGVAVFLVRPPGRFPNLPASIVEVPRHESEGLDLSDATGWQQCPEVVRYLRGVPRAARLVSRRFLLFDLYSMHAEFTLRHRGVHLSEHTLAIGIGSEGLLRVDDVRCFFDLYESLRRVFSDMNDIVMWILVCHMLVRPHLVDNARSMVCPGELVSDTWSS